jgi:hypothetical protein
MENSRKQSIQKLKNPYTGEMMEGKTYSGKELFWEDENDSNPVPSSNKQKK